MSQLSRIYHAFPLVAQTGFEAQKPTPTPDFPILWVLVPAVALASVGLFIWLSRTTERATQNHLDKLAAQDIANWLSQNSSVSPKTLLGYLTSRNVPADFQQHYARAIDLVMLKLERQSNQYFFTTSIFTIDPKQANAKIVNIRRQIAYDDLPTAVQTRFIQGETELEIPWSPVFQLQSSTQSA